MAQYLYKVRAGDTILSVCLAWGLTWDEFAELNPDFNPTGHRYAGELNTGERVVVGYTHRVFDRIRVGEKKKLK